MTTLVEDEFDDYDIDRLYQEFLEQDAKAKADAARAIRRAGQMGGRHG